MNSYTDIPFTTMLENTVVENNSEALERYIKGMEELRKRQPRVSVYKPSLWSRIKDKLVDVGLTVLVALVVALGAVVEGVLAAIMLVVALAPVALIGFICWAIYKVVMMWT